MDSIEMVNRIGLGFLAVCLAEAAASDLEERRIPDRVPIMMIAGRMVLAAMEGTAGCILKNGAVRDVADLPAGILGMAVGFGVMALILLLFPRSFGGGDVKLLTAGGLWLGWQRTMAALVCALYAAAIWCVFQWICRGRSRLKRKVAFGPFLCLGLVAAWYRGWEIWDWWCG